MAAITPTSVRRENIGSVNLLICAFAGTADDDDTWASGLDSVLGYWACRTDDPTQGTEGIGMSVSSGTFTFYLGEDNAAFTLYVLTTN